MIQVGNSAEVFDATFQIVTKVHKVASNIRGKKNRKFAIFNLFGNLDIVLPVSKWHLRRRMVQIFLRILPPDTRRKAGRPKRTVWPRPEQRSVIGWEYDSITALT